MSDELMDGRDLRNRRPIRDDDAESAENEDQAPVVRSIQADDAPSGPYVVLIPPTEAQPAESLLPPESDNAYEVQEPVARVSLRPSAPDEMVPHFHTPTGELPPVSDAETTPVASVTEIMHSTPDQAEETRPASEPHRYLTSDALPATPPTREVRPPDQTDFIPDLHTPTDELAPVADSEPESPDEIPRIVYDEEADFVVSGADPAPEPTSPDQIMRLPRIQPSEDDPAEPPPSAPEPTRPSIGTETLPRPDFIPMLHTPTGELPPVPDEDSTPVSLPTSDLTAIEAESADSDDFIPHFHTPTGELPAVDEQRLPRAHPIQEAYDSANYEIVTGEYDDMDDEVAYVLEVGQQLDGSEVDPLDRRVRSQRPASRQPSEQISAAYEAVRKYGWRAIPILLAIIAVIAMVVFLPTNFGQINRRGTPTLTVPAVGEMATITLSAGGGGDGTPISPTAAVSATPLPPYAQGRIAFASNQDGDFDIYVRDLPTDQQTAITDNGAADRQPAWSPDGRQIVFVSDLAGTSDVYIINADGTGLVQLTNSDADDHSPAWSPDGSTILFAREDINGSALATLDLDCLGGSPPGSCEAAVTLISSERYDLSPRWSPDGSRIIFAASDLPGYPLRIALMDTLGRGFTPLLGTQSSDYAPVWSPDESRIAFVSYANGDDEIFIMQPDGLGVLQLTANPAIDTAPIWSPDGAYIVFASDRSPTGDFDLYLIDVSCLPDTPTCEQGVRPITNDSADSLDPAWTQSR